MNQKPPISPKLRLVREKSQGTGELAKNKTDEVISPKDEKMKTSENASIKSNQIFLSYSSKTEDKVIKIKSLLLEHQ